MKICILGDSHFGARSDSLDFHRYFSRFYDEVFFPFLKESQIDVVFQMGDLFDRRKYINFNSLYLSRKYFFDNCKVNNITLHTLLGNHDVAFKNTLEVNSPALLLKDYDNIKVYEEFTTVNIDGVDIDLVPWICDDNEEEIFGKIKNSKSQICFGHFEISGFEMDKGHVCDIGIDKKSLLKYDVVLSGHFHHKSSNDNITYVGTPYEMTWADCNDPKGFHVFDTETRELHFYQNPIVMFHKIYYDDTQTDFEYWKSYDFQSLKESYVKVVVVNKQNPYLFDHVLDNLYKNNVSDLSIVEDFTDLGTDGNDEDIDQAQDTITILSNYIDNLELDVESEKLKTIMRELYVEALNVEVTD